MIWKLYESHARSFARIVHGVPLSWDSNAAATVIPYTVDLAVWSSSSRFIAICGETKQQIPVDVLDSTTLQRLQSFTVSGRGRAYPGALVLSPNGRMLSFLCPDNSGNTFVSTWDLQTGGLVSRIEFPSLSPRGNVHMTYSMNGEMVGVLARNSSTARISIVDVISGVHTHHVYPETPWTYGIWTHGGSLRFATTEGAVITIWGVEFTQGATRREIETLSIPDDVNQAAAFDRGTEQDAGRTQFFPVPCRIAFTRPSSASVDELVVWGPRNSVSMLHEESASWYQKTTFSDGHFFACSTTGPEVYLWKESPTGYTLIGRLPTNTGRSVPLLSPNGESIIAICGPTIQLWHTKDFTTPSSLLDHVPHCAEDFVLEFVPGGQLAVVARQGEETVTVLDLKSGLPQLTIDASMKVYGLRVAGNAVVVIGDGVIITWNLPEGNSLPHARVGVKNSTRTTSFGGGGQGNAITASISLDFRYVAVLRMEPTQTVDFKLHLYCLSTGFHSHDYLSSVASLWFDPDGLLCSARKGMVWQRGIRQPDSAQCWYPLERLPSGSPWTSSRGYKVTDDGWLIDPGGKRLLVFPPPWKSYPEKRVWNGQFLALLHGSLPQPVILELAP